MEEPFDRLKQARHRAGFKTATAAANAFGWNENTYRSHENGERGLRGMLAARYAKAFHVTVSWLLTGEGAGPSGTAQSTITMSAEDLREVMVLVLRAQGTDLEHATGLAELAVKCLSEPPLVSVGGDRLRSLAVRLELQARQSSGLAPQ